MAGEKQMVPGFNHNVKHRGTPYHVQTEDSGIDNPRIITHLFVGGNVIASKKTSYADIVGAENLTQVVRELMEEQHKEMLRNLISGVYDDTQEEAAARACAFQPGQIGSRSDRAAAPRAAAAPACSAVPPAPQLPRPMVVQRAPEPRAAPPRPPPIPRPVAANAAPPRGAPAQVSERRSGPPAPAPTAAAAARLPRPAPAPAMVAQADGSPSGQQRRDAAEVVFGEDLISEKSLDEVILSYLAEDLVEKS